MALSPSPDLSKPLQSFERQFGADASEVGDDHGCQTGQRRQARAAEPEHHGERGEWQSIAAGDTGCRPRGAGETVFNAEPGREHSTSDIADGEEWDKDASASA